MHLATRLLLASFAVLALGGASCATTAEVDPRSSSDTAVVHARVVQLEAEARALASVAGCSTASQCRTAPVGDRPCGGPRTYLAWCSATTDSAALFKKLGELVAAEKRYNELAGLASTCEFRTPPGVELSGGSCRTATPAGANR